MNTQFNSNGKPAPKQSCQANQPQITLLDFEVELRELSIDDLVEVLAYVMFLKSQHKGPQSN